MIHVNIEGFSMVMEVLGLVVGVVGTFVVFFGFLTKKNEHRFSGALAKLYDFLNFKSCIIEDVVKFLYVLAACLCTGVGLFKVLSVVGLTKGLILLVGGNLAVRIFFEISMLFIKACKNLGLLERGKQQEDTSQGELEFQPEVEQKEKVKISKPPKYRICPNCGENCSDKFEFCNICGTKLS